MTSIITSSVGAGIIGGYNTQRRATAFVDQGQRLLDDGFTASVTIILNGVNSFLYQIMLAPLYFQIALQKTIVCTTNDVFAIFDATGTKIRVGRPDLQKASDVSSGVCVSAFFAAKLDAFLESKSQNQMVQAATQVSQSASRAAGTVILGSTTKDMDVLGGRSARILQLMTGTKPFSTDAAQAAMRQAKASTAGQKVRSMVDRLKNNKLVKKIGTLLSKLQLSMPIHTVDSFITYFIGVISGMQDMAQVKYFATLLKKEKKKEK